MEIPATYAQINFRYTGGAAPTGAEWTLGVDNQIGAFSAEDVAQLAITAYTDSDLNELQVTDITLSSVRVKLGPNETGDFHEEGANVAGTDTDPGAPSNYAVLVKKTTTTGGRAGRGRLYFPGPPENVVGDGGELESVYRSGAQSRFDAFFIALDAADLRPVVLHNETSPLSVPTPMTGFTVDILGATQRRRMRR